MKSRLRYSLVLVCLAVGACSTAKVDPYLGHAAPEIYAKGHTYLQKKNYSDAITAFQSLDAQYPFYPETEQADLEMIYAQYAADEPALAVSAINRFMRMYPNSVHLDYVYYMKGVLNFENGRSFLQRYMPYDMARHPVDAYVNSYQDLSVVVTHYPKSAYAEDARHRMLFLINTMAQFELDVAEYYFEMKAYVSAINRANEVVVHYPQTPAVQGALKVLADSYAALKLKELEVSSKALLKANSSS